MNPGKYLLIVVFLFTPLLINAQTADTLLTGLVGHWKFDSINTLITPDESGTGNTGTVGTSSRLVSGKFGQALRMDLGGSQQFMTIKNNFGSPQWSISTWVNPDVPIATSSPYSGAYTFFSADQAPSGTSQMLLVTKDDVRTYGGSIGRYSFGNNPGWHHVIVTYDGTSLTTYVDGTLRGTTPYTNILASSIKRYIGTNAGPARGHVFVGAIDETRLYNRVLNTAEITALFNNRANTVTTTPVATTTTPVVTAPAPAPALAPAVTPQVLAPALPALPTTKITSNFTVSTDKTIYKLGDTVRMSATMTLDPAWVNYLKTVKGDTKAEVFFEVKNPDTNTFIVQVPVAFDLVNTSVTKTYDWVTPATNTALAGKTFNASFTVRDASKTVTDMKTVNGLAFEALPVAVVAPVPGVTNDGATVDESKIPAGTSPDIFAGVLASQDLLPSQFKIISRYYEYMATTTNTTATFPVTHTKMAGENLRGRFRFSAITPINLSNYNTIDVVVENISDVPVRIALQGVEGPTSTAYFQSYHWLPARSGPKHVLLPLDPHMFECTTITGTRDCPLSPRQALPTSAFIGGNPPKTIGEIRVFVEYMPQGGQLKTYSMKAMRISYEPQYLKNYIDKYGQNNWVNFPEKITSDEQLKADARAERTTLRPLPSIWDQFGGDKTATGYGATGKFKTQKVNGKWWLVNPLGNLTYITAVTQVDYTLTPGYVGDPSSTRRGAYVALDRSGLLSNAFKDNQACHGVGIFCGGTTWSPYVSNIIKKYDTGGLTFGQIIEKWRLNQTNRMREWGFNIMTDRYAENLDGWRNGVRDIPYITQFNIKGKTTYQKVPGTQDRLPDPFDPAFEVQMNSSMNRYFNLKYPGTTLSVKEDPYAIGTAPDNEIPWGLGGEKETDPRKIYGNMLKVLEQGSGQYAKVAFTNILKEKYNNNFSGLQSAWGDALPSNINSWEAFQNNAVTVNGTITTNVRADLSLLLRKFTDKYLTIAKTAIKREGGESHLFTGVRFAGFYRTPREVIDSCAAICDIISINYYNYTTADERADWDYLLSKDVPILITEFYFDSPSRGSAMVSRTHTTTDEDQGTAFKNYTRDLLRKPQVIGYSYHDVYDQPLLGSIWTENNQTGFISETDRPYVKLVEAAKDINFNVYNIRGSAPNGGAPITTYTLDVNKVGTGTVTGGGINCGTDCSDTLNAGSSVTLTAAPATGFTFAGWSGACTGTGTCAISMNAAKTVTATFAAIVQTSTLTVTKVGTGTVVGAGISCGTDCTETVTSGTTISLTAAPATGFTFTGWSGACTGTGACSVVVNAAKTATATFTAIPQMYVLTVTKVGVGTVTGGGIACGTDCTQAHTAGTDVILTATPATGYTFTGWSLCTGTGACTVDMNAAKTVTATFTRINTVPTVSPINVNTTGAPVTFNLAGSDNEGDTLTYTTGVAPTKGTLRRNSEGNYTYTINAPIPETAFVDGFNYNASDGRLTAVAARVTINYTPSTYKLTTTKTGNGTVTATGINCGTDCENAYAVGTLVTVTATPTIGNVFSGWSGSCTGTGACTVTMNAAKTVTATFNQITHSINVTKVGNGTVTGGTISCGATCQNVFNYGATVTLTATPVAGHIFTGWSGACTGAGTCSMTMNANKNITATFERVNTAPRTQDVTFTIPSPATTATIVVSGTDTEGDALLYTVGTPTKGTLRKNSEGNYTYTITAPVPTTGFVDTFNYYASDGKLTSPASKVTVNYTITPPTTFTMTVAKVGNGTVTAPGIACGGDCQGDFVKDTTAVLTATPSAGYTFTGWSACTGTATCNVTMNAAKTVTATFTKINTAPAATAVNATVNTSGVALLTLVGTDTDGDTLTYTPGTPANGTLVRTGVGEYTYTVKTPHPNTLVVDRFTYTVSDGRLTSPTANIAVTIPGLPNEPPPTVDTDGDGVIDGNDLCPGTPAAFRSQVNASGCIKPKVSVFDIKPTFEGAVRDLIGLELGKRNVAKIKYTQPVSVFRNTEQVDLDSNVVISNKRVEVKSTATPELNKPAIITFYGVTEKNPRIMRDGVECKAPQCVIGPNVNGVVEVTVTGF